MREKIVVPSAPILIESIRSLGYSFETALADIIDNSISAEASVIQVFFSSREPQWLAVVDNGHGMTEAELEAAMCYGSRNPCDKRRVGDLGRFGLGMKTASLSQCRKLTVISKRQRSVAAACWDLDRIAQTGDWTMQSWSGVEARQVGGCEFLDPYAAGTAVVWRAFDHLQQESANVQQTFDEKIDLARKHIELVFHRFLNAEGKNRVSITFNGEPLVGCDPFLTHHPATQPMPEQKLRINGEDITVKPYILPFSGKLGAKDVRNIGGMDELRQQQGFYVYRNKRLIIWGTWFRLLRQGELGKLARIRVDIPNTLDSVWEIDIKKSTASLPAFIKKSLTDIVRNATGRSEKVYRYRGRNIQNDSLSHLWEPIDERGTFHYRINRKSPIYSLLAETLDERALPLLDSFIKMLEDTFPYGDVYYRLAKNETSLNKGDVGADEAYTIVKRMIQQIENVGGDLRQFLATVDRMDFFVKYPDVVAKVREEYTND